MGRVYSGRFIETVSGVNDLLTLTAPSTSTLRIISINIGQADSGGAEAEILPIRVVRYASAGSGGTSRFMNPFNRGHATTGALTVSFNTTVGTTPTVLLQEAWNVQIPWLTTPILWDDELWVPPSGVLAVNLPTAPADAFFCGGGIVFEEFD